MGSPRQRNEAHPFLWRSTLQLPASPKEWGDKINTLVEINKENHRAQIRTQQSENANKPNNNVQNSNQSNMLEKVKPPADGSTEDMEISDEEEEGKEEKRKQELYDQFVRKTIYLLGNGMTQNIQKDIIKVKLQFLIWCQINLLQIFERSIINKYNTWWQEQQEAEAEKSRIQAANNLRPEVHSTSI